MSPFPFCRYVVPEALSYLITKRSCAKPFQHADGSFGPVPQIEQRTLEQKVLSSFRSRKRHLCFLLRTLLGFLADSLAEYRQGTPKQRRLEPRRQLLERSLQAP